MNFFTFIFVILTSVCIKLSQCCRATPPLHTTTITIRRITEGDDYLMFGSLLRKNIVITTPHYLFDANVNEVVAEANCERLTKKISSSSSCIRKSVSKIILEDDYNITKNFMDSIAIVILKTPYIISNSIRIIPLAEDIELPLTSKCLHVKRDYSRYVKDVDEVIFYHGSFHKDAFNYQAKFKKTTLISKFAFNYSGFSKLKNKTSLYNFILEQDNDIQIFHDLDKKYLGTPIVCPDIMNPSMYFQVGVANYFFLVNSKTGDPDQSKKILYFISVIDREYEILEKVHKALSLDRIQT